MTRDGVPGTGPLPSGWWAAGLLPAEDDGHDGTAPDWAVTVGRVVANPVAGSPTVTGDGAVDNSAAGCLAPALEPFVADAVAALTLRVTDGPAAIPAAVLAPAMASALRSRLVQVSTRTLVLELHRARAAGELTAPDPGGRFAQFTARTATATGLRDLVTTYPVLARLIGQICDQEVRAAAELSDRFAADRAAIVDGLLGGTDPGAVTTVTIGAGDRHGGGRSVALVRFGGGARVVYKPRPVTLHHRFAELVAVLDDAAPGLAPRAVRALDRDGHGWVEFVSRRTCATDAEVERFHRRQGALLALLHALDATDAHCENVVARGDQPVLVDVETLLHPTPRQAGPVGADPALRALAASVQRTALLPRPLLGEHGAFDLSALGGRAGVVSDPGVRVEEAGTDRMHLVRGTVHYAGGESGPTLRGEPVDPRRHRADLLAGFRAAYDVLRARASTLLAGDGPVARCASVPVRFVVRDTSTYSRMLDESTHPDLMRRAVDRHAVLAGLREDAPLPHLVDHELADLWAGDIPLFTVRPGRRDVWSSAGVLSADLLEEPVLDRVRRKLATMGPTDHERQEWLIRASLALADGPLEHRSATGSRRAGCAPAGTDRLLAAACAVGDQVVALAERDERRANWVGVQQVDNRFWAVLPLGAGLAEGYPGVALFLAQLGAVTGIPRYTELARHAISPLPWLVATMADPQWAGAVGCGAFSGLGGICYALARLSALLDDPAPAQLLPAAIEATVVAAGPADAPHPDTSIDTGLAGGLAALHAVYTETGLGGAAVDELGARLAAAPEPGGDDAGFLRGATGVGWALRRAGRPAATVGGRPGDLGWCRGTAGALLAASGTGPDPMAPAPAMTAAGPPLAEHSLCHGEAGVLDALLELGGEQDCRSRAAQLLSALAEDGPRCSTPSGLTSPGLLTGLSGVGHTLVRLACPDRVPSVLLLQPTPGRFRPATPGGTASRELRSGPEVRTVPDVRSRHVTLEER